MTGSIKTIEKEWESGLFGKNVFMLKFEPDMEVERYIDDVEKAQAMLNRQGPCLLMSRISCLDTPARRALEATGFHLMECYIELEHHLADVGAPSGKNRIRPFRHEEIDDLQRIALSAFQYSRFHMDWQIDREAADLSRSEWIKNACLGRAEFVLVAEQEGAPVGFVSCVRKGHGEEAVGQLDLIAVDSRYRKRRLGYDLVTAFLAMCKAKGISKSIVGTQAHNTPSIRLYERCGYCTTKTYFSYHKHL